MPNINKIDNFIPISIEKKPIQMSKPRDADDKKLMDACQQFESLFYYQMLKEMRKTIPKDGLLPESNEQNIYASMLDEEVAKLISKGNASISQILFEQLRDKSKDTKTEDETENVEGKKFLRPDRGR
jgi:flagellar protein FlgJ